jgi:hypothetical protein
MGERFLVPTRLPRRLHLSAHLNLSQDELLLTGRGQLLEGVQIGLELNMG